MKRNKAYLRIPRSFIALPLLVVAGAAVCIIGAWSGEGRDHPQHIDAVFASGIEWLTSGKVSVGRIEETVLLVVILVLVRQFRLDLLAVRPGSMEVRPLDAAGVKLEGTTPEARDARLRRLSTEFREYLSSARIYETTTVPGDLETDRIIEVLKSTQQSGRLATLAAVWSFIWPARAYVVTATLRTRPESPPFGVSVAVRRLPGGSRELDPQWSGDFERALQRAAFAVTAHVLPSTWACRSAPWSEWAKSRGPMPVELMRHYQRAKRMVGERRYDEALSLYHNALLYDADNFYLRYDVGQILERLQLYPDALAQYADLTERLFPVEPWPAAPKPPLVEPGRRRLPRPSGRRRPTTNQPSASQLPAAQHPVIRSTRRPFSALSDPFLVRYRYLSVLGTARRLSEELLQPDWPALQDWLRWQTGPTQSPEPPGGRGQRPWRAIELIDLRRRLAEQFDPIWQESLAGRAVLAGSRKDPALGLSGVLLSEPQSSAPPSFVDALPADSLWRQLNPQQARLLAVEEYLLAIAEAETDLLVDHLRKRTRRRQAPSSLTQVTLTLMQLFVSYRKRRLAAELSRGARPGTPSPVWPPTREEIDQDLSKAGYHEASESWLEHYIVACFLALPLGDDQEEIPEHRRYAEAAVRALERAQKCGDDIEFVISKRYWLLAGDPDLAGLRQYDCFSAFESRVYLHPQPPIRDSAKYELFHYLRQGLERGAHQMEEIWTQRAHLSVQLDGPELESWFRAERRAWEVCVRLGRFYRQWQTRSSALDSLRNLISGYGGEPVPVPYPEVIRDYVLIGVGVSENTKARLTGMEGIFTHLATSLGNAASLDGQSAGPQVENGPPENIIDKTRSWIWYAEHCSRGQAELPTEQERVDLCRSQAAVWTALRQWVTTPARRDNQAFENAVRRVRVPRQIDLTQAEPGDHPARPHEARDRPAPPFG